MRAPATYDYAIVRLVPRVERQEFINVGAILSCPEHSFLAAHVEFDAARVQALWPYVDAGLVQAHLASVPVICRGGPDAGPIGRLSPRERFHWLVAPRSTIIQTSAVHTGQCRDPKAMLERLMERMVRVTLGPET